MYNRDIEILYNWLTWGTKVYIVGGNFPYNIPWRNIDDGDRGSDVWEVQNRLKELGYYKWRPDGVFGWGTQNAVKKFQKDNKLPVDGKVSWTTLHKMGLYLFQ
ncbi:MAG: peptidoglycan-binding protein [Halanaerobiales bacterium]|nr:peptidoglycan-binding protein [Halanaerobiales bacterium]